MFRPHPPATRADRRAAGVRAATAIATMLVGLDAAPGWTQELAQDFPRVAPKEPAPNAPVDTVPAPPLPPERVPGGEAVILPALRGVVFVGRASAIRRDGATAEGVVTAGVDVIDSDDFRARVAPYVGQPVTLDRLNEITRLTVLYYRDHDRPLVDVIVPEQDISSGTVQILALEFVAGGVRAEGNRWFSDALLTGEIRTRAGERISAQRLLDDINWLNQNPFRRVDLVYERAAEPGRSDIVLRTEDRLPVRVFGGYEDTGTRATTRERTFVGFNWGNVLGLDHQLSYQFTASPDFWTDGMDRARVTAHSGSYFIPLPWRHKLTLFGSYAESAPAVEQLFNLQARSSQASARYGVPLPSAGGVEHELLAGFDHKSTNNDLDFGGLRVSQTTADVAQLMVGYAGSRPDSFGVTGFGLSVFASPGGLGDGNTTAAFETIRAGARARYGYARADVSRVTTLPHGLSWVVRLQGQLASGTLLPTEQLGFGGALSVRGYDERQVNGDQGVLISNELRGPEWSLRALLTGEAEGNDRFQLLAFFDYGAANNRDPGPADRRWADLAGTGVGFRYALGANVSARFDYGWKLIDAPGGFQGDGLPHVGLTIAY